MPRAGLTPDVIVSEAALLVDEVGRERLTLSELAKRFGVAQPSLYKHVDGLDHVHGLLAVEVQRAVGDGLRRASTGQAGSEALDSLATAYRDSALAHPGCYAYVLRAPTPDHDDHAAAAGQILSALTGMLAGYGITGASAIDAARFVRSALHRFVSLELGGGFGMPRSVDRSYRRLVVAVDQALADLWAPRPWVRPAPGRPGPRARRSRSRRWPGRRREGPATGPDHGPCRRSRTGSGRSAWPRPGHASCRCS